jgi:hypothetical protein
MSNRPRTPQEIELHRWSKAHPGIIKKIADMCRVSRPMVSLVMWKKRNSFDGQVEECLRKLGCPGWTK